MPVRPKKPCAQPGCPRLVRDRPRCEEHTKAKRRRDDARRKSYRERGYDARWDRVAAWYRSKYPLCEDCADRGETVLGEFVHHVVPWQEGGAKYDEDNLRHLCRTCHARAHARLERER